MKKSTLLLFAISVLISLNAQLPGSLDTTFGTGGLVQNIVGGKSFGYSLALQSDEKIILAGMSGNPYIGSFCMSRYHPDGAIDSSFGLNGNVISYFTSHHYVAREALVRYDDKIILVGYVYHPYTIGKDLVIARYHPDGSIDSSFGNNGRITHDFGVYADVKTAALQSDGKVVAAGNFNDTLSGGFVARFNIDGSIDSSFGSIGYVRIENDIYSEINDIAIQQDGRIVGAGLTNTNNSQTDWQDILLVRFNPNGSLDSTFGNSGIVTTSSPGIHLQADCVTIQQNGKIVIGGKKQFSNATAQLLAARYNVDGILDSTFGNNGIQAFSLGGIDCSFRSVVIQPGDDILLGGTTDAYYGTGKFAIACLTPDGNLNPQFDSDGMVETSFSTNDTSFAGIHSMVVLPDGKIIAGGNATMQSMPNIMGFALARYHTGNFLSTPESNDYSNPASLKLYPNPSLDVINVEFQLTSNSDITIQITDLTGRVIQQNVFKGIVSEGYNLQTINLSPALNSGIYVLTLTTKEGYSSMRFVKN